MKRTLVLIPIVLWLNSCAPLTKSQVKMSGTYFDVVANHPKYIRNLHNELAELRLEGDNLAGALQPSDSVRINALITSIDTFESSTKLPDSVHQQLDFINQYIQTYYSIIPDGMGIYQTLKGTTETLGGVLGVGGIVGSLLPNREPGLSAKKKAKLQNHLISEEAALDQSLGDLQLFLSAYYLPMLDSFDRKTTRDFRSLLESIANDKTPLAYYTRYNRLVTRYYKKLILTKSLTKLLIESIDTFKAANHQLVARSRERAKLDFTESHLNKLVVEVSKINESLQELQQISLQ